MSSFIGKLVVLSATTLSLGSVACVIGQERHEVIEYDPHLATAGLVCQSPFVKADLSKLTACKGGGGKGTGKGHCYPRMKAGLDAEAAEEFADEACKPDEVCVGDKFLEANGTELKKCTFKIGTPQEGRCMANLSKQMAANFALMKEGDTECDDDEACSPCIHPIKKEDTHICQKVGVHAQDCTEGEKGKQVELCCMGLGICMDKDSAPAGAGDKLPTDSCQKSETQICAPAGLIDSKFEKCDVAGIDGVCLPICFADMVKGAQAGVRSSCNALSFCLPCAGAKLAGFDMPGCN